MTHPERPSLAEAAPLALLFHENTKINAATRGRLAESVSEFSSDIDEVRRSLTAAKTYPGEKRIELARLGPLPAPSAPLEQVLACRRAVRAFRKEPLPLATLAALIHHAGRVTGAMRHPDDPDLTQILRAAPSGGGLHPVETYAVALDVAGLERGTYHYHAPQSCLEAAGGAPTRERLAELILTSTGRLDAPCLLVLAGRWELPLRKYGDRGYRVLLLDAGHLAENLLLVAAALGLGACPIAGFHDDALASELGLDPRQEPVLEVIEVGRAGNLPGR